MKKSLLSLATLVAAATLSMAADCSGTNVEACTSDADCTDQVCDVANETCVTAVCDADADCDLANPDSPTSAEDCAVDADCDSSAGPAVCVVDGVGVAYCAIEDGDAAESCAQNSAGPFDVVTVDGKDVCVVASGESCDDASQCVAG